MRPFAELTEVGQARRMRRLAVAALEQHDLDVARLRWVTTEFNTIFRVDTTDGRTFALRVEADYSDGTHVDSETELAWLEALADVDAIDAVQVFRTRSGDTSVVVEDPGVPLARRCVLFSWIPGAPIGEEATPADYRRLGALAGRLHDHASGWTPPDSQHSVWDRIHFHPDEPIVLYDDAHAALMTPQRVEIVRAVEEIAGAELARLHREHEPMVLHGDLHPWNVHRYRSRIIAFDFEDVMIGTPAQDIATTLFYNRTEDHYPELRTGFEEGYRTVREWPVEFEGQLEIIMAARTVSFLNYVLHTGLNTEEHVPRMTERIAGIL